MSIETGTITLENSLFGEKEFEATEVMTDGSGGGGGGANQYIVETGTTTPRMVYEAIQQGKSIVLQGTTSEELTNTFPPTDDMEDVYYNNISDATPLMMHYYVDTDTEVTSVNYQLLTFYGQMLAVSYDPDEPFEA